MFGSRFMMLNNLETHLHVMSLLDIEAAKSF